MAVFAALAVPSFWSAGPADAAPTELPADPAAYGYVGLCNETGQNVTGGSIDARPFVWKAVSSTRPPAAYQGPGQSAVLNIYQPRPEIDPADWSGASLTAATFYSTPTHPTVQATYADQSLRDFIRQFPAKVNGLYQLRVYYGKANYGLYSTRYPVTTIQVTGSRWQVINGGTVACARAKGVSNEQLTGVVAKADVTPRHPTTEQQVAAVGAGRSITTRPAPGVSVDRSGQVTTTRSNGDGARDRASAGDTGSNPSWVLWTLAGVVGLLVLALVLVLRARRSPPSTS